MKTFLSLFLTTFLAMGVVPAVSAKPLSKILAQSGMSPEDFDMMAAAERSLYVDKTPRVGQTATWSNPDTASNGTVRVDAVKDNCVTLSGQVFPKGRAEAVKLNTRMCKSADGRWLLSL